MAKSLLDLKDRIAGFFHSFNQPVTARGIGSPRPSMPQPMQGFNQPIRARSIGSNRPNFSQPFNTPIVGGLIRQYIYNPDQPVGQSKFLPGNIINRYAPANTASMKFGPASPQAIGALTDANLAIMAGLSGGGPKLKPSKINIHPEDMGVMKQFAATVDQLGQKANRVNLGQLGLDAQRVVEKYFGRRFASLPNSKIKQLFDYGLAKREGGLVIEPKGVQIPAGLSAQEGKGLARQALKKPKPVSVQKNQLHQMPQVPKGVEGKWFSGSDTPTPSGRYTYLTPDKTYASNFGKNITEYSFTPKNAVDFTGLGQKPITFSKLQSILKEHGVNIDKSMVDENYQSGVSEPTWFWLRRYQNIVDEIAKSGKDSILLKESIGKGTAKDSAIVLNRSISTPTTQGVEKLELPKNLSITDAYPKNFLGYNMKGLEKKASEKGYHLYDALIKRVDSQDNINGKIKGMESIMDDLYGGIKLTPEQQAAKAKPVSVPKNQLPQMPQVPGLPKQGQVPMKPGSQTPQMPEVAKGTIPQGIKEGKISSSPITLPENKPFYNVDRVGTTKKGKALVDKTIGEIAPEINKVVGKKLSHQEVIATAKNTAETLNRTIGRAETEKLGAQALNLRNKIADMSKRGVADEAFIQALIDDKAFSANIARLLGQRRIVSDPTQGKLVNKILANVLKHTEDTDAVIKAAKGVDFNDTKQATDFYRKFVAPKASEWMDALRYNSMLSSPNTHINNIFSNAQGTGIIAPIEKTVTGMVDFLKSTATGSKREYLAGEGAAYAKGYYSNLRNAAHKFGDVMSGKKLSDMQELHNIPLSTGGGKKAAENFLTFPGKVLQATDEFFQTLTEGGATSAYKYKIKGGIDVANMEQKAYLEGRKRLFNAEFGLPEEGYVLKALEYLPAKILEAKGSSNPLVATISKFIFPFVRVPANILKQGVEYGPAGFSTMWGATNKTEQFSKAIMGTSIGVGSAILLGSDRLSWAEPQNQTQKNAFRAAGYQPYSIKIGNHWVSYAKLHPSIAFNLALVAAVNDSLKNGKLDDSQADTVLAGLAKWVNFFADQSYVKNIGDFVNATKGNASGFSQFVSNAPQQLIPLRALLGWVNRIIDPYQRQVDPTGSILDKQLQFIASNIPLLAQQLPTRKDKLGNPIENQNRLINSVSPMRITTERPEQKQIYDEMKAKSRETSLDNQAKDKLKASNETVSTRENKVYILQDNGDVKTIDLSFQPTLPELTGQAELDKKLISKYKGEITRKANDVVDLYQAGKISLDEAEKQLEALKSASSSVAGAKKGRKMTFKFAKVKAIKPLKIKLAKTPKMKIGKNTFKIAKAKQPKLKPFNLKKFKVAKIKTKFSSKPSLT